ncbi:recombinase family protein [Candidatus Woesebacteria bacterium]|nr:recombinase family protein [Candidatus Woesebacteria bacterium]
MNNEDNEQKRVALYLRVSTEDQKEKYGLDLQEQAIRSLVQSKKFPDGRDKYIVDDKFIFKDDISGTTPMLERPAFRRLTEELANSDKKPFDLVVVYKIDRFARRLQELLNIIGYLEKNKVEFLSANESIDTSTPFGKAMLGIIGVIAELEIETTKLRTQDGRREAVKQGVWMGSAPPFGYKKKLDGTIEILEEEALVIRNIFDMFVTQNYTEQQIADHLASKKVLSPEASAVFYKKRRGTSQKKNTAYFWRANVVAKILQDEVYLGKYYYGKNENGKRVEPSKWKLSPHRHQAIIDDYLFKMAANSLKEKPKYNKVIALPQNSKNVYLLGGLLRCSHCRKTMLMRDLSTWVGDRKKVKSTGRFSHYYKCGNRNARKTSYPCNVLPLPADKIEEFVVEYVRNLLLDPKSVFDYQRELESNKIELTRLRDRRDELRRLLNALPNMISRVKEQHEFGIIDTDTMLAKVKDYDLEQKRLSEEQEKLELQIGQKANLQAYEISLELFSQKYVDKLNDIQEDREKIFEILHMIIDGIVVHSRRPDPSDKIPGRRKTGNYSNRPENKLQISGMTLHTAGTIGLNDREQMVPYEIDIYLRLPQQILINMARKKVLHEDELKQFGANAANL